MIEPTNGSPEGASGARTPVLMLERFAELNAEMEGPAGRGDILDREGVAPPVWEATQEKWLQRMADEAVRNRSELANRYTRAFVARRAALAKPSDEAVVPVLATPAADSRPPASGPVSVPVVPIAGPPSAIAAPPMMAPAVPAIKPAFPFNSAALDPSPRPPALAALPFAPPAMLDSPPRPPALAALPFAPAPVLVDSAPELPPMAAPPPTSAPTASRPSRKTLTNLDNFASMGVPAPLPFASAPQSNAAPRTPSSFVGLPFQSSALPTPLHASPAEATQPTPPRGLPFQSPSLPAAQAAPIQAPPAEAPQPTPPKGLPFQQSAPDAIPRSAPAFKKGRVTQEIALGSRLIDLVGSELAARAQALPFAPTAPSSEQRSVPSTASTAGLPFRPVALNADAAAPPPPAVQQRSDPRAKPHDPTPPVVPNALPPSPRLTLEQMASLSAEIAANPPATTAIRARYGFDGPAYETEIALWKRRFAETEGLYARFTEAYEAYSSWLKRAAR